MSVCVCLCQLVPLLKLLYHAPNDSSHHLSYMALIVILILSEDSCFSKSVHEIVSTTLSLSLHTHVVLGPDAVLIILAVFPAVP